MIKSSKPSETTLSPEIEEQIAKIMAKVAKFQNEVGNILVTAQTSLKNESSDQVITRLFQKFHCVAVNIKRRHNKRSSLEIQDEYDVQDLLRSLLNVNFEDIRDEEYTPSYGGGSTRMDILLKREQTVIETKMMRQSLSQKEVRNELIIDKAHYRVHPDCKKLYALIYDPLSQIKNPRGFERDLSDSLGGMATQVFVVP